MLICLYFLGKSRGERFRPLNHVAVIGDKIRLNCTTLNEDTRYWFRNAPLSADKELLYHKRRTIHSWFSVDQTIPGRCDLLFSSRKIASGRYGCDSDDGTHSAEVIVSGQIFCVNLCIGSSPKKNVIYRGLTPRFEPIRPAHCL